MKINIASGEDFPLEHNQDDYTHNTEVQTSGIDYNDYGSSFKRHRSISTNKNEFDGGNVTEQSSPYVRETALRAVL